MNYKLLRRKIKIITWIEPTEQTQTFQPGTDLYSGEHHFAEVAEAIGKQCHEKWPAQTCLMPILNIRQVRVLIEQRNIQVISPIKTDQNAIYSTKRKSFQTWMDFFWMSFSVWWQLNAPFDASYCFFAVTSSNKIYISTKKLFFEGKQIQKI